MVLTGLSVTVRMAARKSRAMRGVGRVSISTTWSSPTTKPQLGSKSLM
jgi:hypothetical protein